MELQGFTKAGERLRCRQCAAYWLIELVSPVHGRWMVVAEHTNMQLAHEDFDRWTT